MRLIPYGRQDISDDDVAAVVEALRSDWLTQGPGVTDFEKGMAERLQARHAIAVNSATSALHLACRVLGLGAGDRLWTSPNTFVASANCALYCGADVDFVDVDPRSYNMSVEALAAKLEKAEREGHLPKVVIPVHFAGQSCDMEGIHALSQRYGFAIVEDASHAVGATYQGTPVGSGRYADITILSFHPVKILTTAEGGMLLTNRDELAEGIALLRSHGITRNPEQMSQPDEGPWYYEQVDLGYNYRMPDVLARLGLSQLARLDSFLDRRHVLAQRYAEGLAGLPLLLPWQDPSGRSALHLYPIQVAASAPPRRVVFEALRAAGILVNVHYIPVHLQPHYRKLGFGPGDFPVAEAYYQRAISIPMFHGLSDDDQDRVMASLREAVRA